MVQLYHIDLFSGIGGFSFALQEVAKTIAYVENAYDAQQVLKTLISKNKLSRAPIFDDIKLYHPPLEKKSNPIIVTGGFPCQDISTIGKRLGIKCGKRSSLVWEMFRIIEEVNASFVVMENVAAIVKDSYFLKIIRKFEKLGYHIEHGVFSAGELGFWHIRKRWYLLAIRKNTTHKLQTIPGIKKDLVRFTSNPPESLLRFQKSYKPLWKRKDLLGNAIVPATAKYAINCLNNNCNYNLTCNLTNSLCNQKRLLYFHGHDGSKNVTYVKNYFSTPRLTHPPHSRKLTHRTYQDLETQLVHWDKTKKNLRKAAKKKPIEAIVNPEFVEWLMGYPPGWTKTI